MAYIGTSPSNGVRRRFVYVATANQTSFSGNDENGTSLVYVDVAYLDVYQNGVKLKSVDDYASTTGTSVVLVQGASADDVVEIIAFDVFSVADTVSAGSGGSFGGNIGIGGTLSVTGNVVSPITLGGTTPTLTIGDAGAEDAKIVFDGNAQDYHIGVDDTNDSLVIGLGGTLGTTDSMRFDAAGIITKPLQPAFHATKNNTDQSNVAIGGETVVWAAEHFDQNADFDLGNNRFVAPVTGRYFFNISMRLGALDTAANFYSININTSNRSYDYIFAPKFTADLVYYSVSYSIFADMDASDTANIIINQNAGTAQTDIIGSIHYTHFSGYLVA